MKKMTVYFLMLLMLVFGITGCGSENDKTGMKSFDDIDKVPAFACKDLDGNDVSEDIFSDSKLTLINIWATG